MKSSCIERNLTVLAGLILFSSTIHINAACNAPPGQTCTFTLSATDDNDSTRVASDGKTLQMVGVSRNATLTATAEDPATFDTDEPSWSNGSTGSSVSHTGGSVDYTATAFGTSKSISIEQKSGADHTLTISTDPKIATITAGLSTYSTKLGIGVSPTVDVGATYSWKYVDLKNSPNVGKFHTFSLATSAGLEWEEMGVVGLSKTIKIGSSEIKCGAYSGGKIGVSLTGEATYDPNKQGTQDPNSVVAKLTGNAYLKLQGKCVIETWYLKAGVGAEASANFSLGASTGVIITDTGITSSDAKITYGVKLTGIAYAFINDAKVFKEWSHEPVSLQGEQPIPFSYTF